MKTILKIILLVVFTIILFAGGGLFYISRGLDTGSQLVIKDIELSSVKDGTYQGTYNGGRWTNQVSVVVAGNKITNIKLLKDVLLSKEELTEGLFSRVIAEQQLDVDVISGSTVTSKAYLKAIENALTKEGR